MNQSFEIIIVGGGLAGLTAAIHLAKSGKKVALFEKEHYPKHKVCGEYISNEVKSYFNWLGIDLDVLNPVTINKTQISIASGQSIFANLPLGGFGVSRYDLDHHLCQKALSLNVQFYFENVTEINFKDHIFSIKTINEQAYFAPIALGCFGKRSTLDFSLKRSFLQKKSPWLGVKSHFQGHFPSDLVGLHHFEGGYCGVSHVGKDTINICYLVAFKTFQRFKNIQDFEENILKSNPHLKEILSHCQPIFDKPLTISQISFESKNPVENHLLMLGDAAGMIHPLCGNGMAMAIHSAKIASEQVLNFLSSKTTRQEMEHQYQLAWNKQFKKRLLFGKMLSKILLNDHLNAIVMRIGLKYPSLIAFLIKNTHGKPIL
jgi:flavin-dependent dehydrogenase